MLVPAAFVDAPVSAGGDDISSCEPQPIIRAETAAIKNNNFFIVFLTSQQAASCGNLGSNLVEKSEAASILS